MCRIHHLQNGGRRERGRERRGEEGRGGEGRGGDGRGGEGRGGERREERGGQGRGREGRGGEEMNLLPAAVAGTGVAHSEVAGSTVQPVREKRRKLWKGCGEREGVFVHREKKGRKKGGGKIHGSWDGVHLYG